jgi:transposase-like protein
MNLIDVHKTFKSDDQCLEHLSTMRWPDGVRCVTCGTDKVQQYTSPTKKQPTRKIYQCQEPTCKEQFTATSGTIFHDTHLPLTKWFMALALMVDAKKGLSAKQLQRHLGVSYQTAWHLAHRIRKAMEDTERPFLSGTVEIDETYIGGKTKIADRYKNKEVVIGLRQRRGPLRFVHAKDAKAGTIYDIIAEHVDKSVEYIMTDENAAYNFTMTKYKGAIHQRIKHKDRVYVRGEVHTNTVENSFSLLKRGIIGNFHQISIKHLQRYLNEFEYRFNRRENPNRFEETLTRLAKGKPLSYQSLTAE